MPYKHKTIVDFSHICFVLVLAINNISHTAQQKSVSLSQAIAQCMLHPLSHKTEAGRSRCELLSSVLEAAQAATLPTSQDTTSHFDTQRAFEAQQSSSSQAPQTPTPEKKIKKETNISYGKMPIKVKCPRENCNKLINTRRLNTHLREHDGLNNYQCSFCSSKCNHKHNAARHYASHILAGKIDCKECLETPWNKDLQKLSPAISQHIKETHLIQLNPKRTNTHKSTPQPDAKKAVEEL